MALRGLLRRRIQRGAELRSSDEYKRAFNMERKKIEKSKAKARTEAIQARAQADARRAATPKSSLFISGMRSVGKLAATQIKKHDPDKFQAFVTGKTIKKKRS